MTYADPALIQARNYLMSLGIPGNSIGIVGDQSHQSSGGYHVGNDVLAAIGKLNTDYSKRQSARDRPGSNAAMALDVGGLTDANLWALSQFLVAQFLAGAPDTLDIREIIYWHAPSNTIKRVDRLGLYFSGDSSHRTHTHLSYFRDSEGRDKTSLFRRCYEPAPAPTPSKEDDDMATLYHVIDDNGTPINTDDMAIFAYVAGGNCRVAVGPAQSLANKIATPPAAPDKGTGNSSGLTKVEWNELMVWMGVAGNRFDAAGIFHPESA